DFFGQMSHQSGLLQHPLVVGEFWLFVLFVAVWGYLLWDQRRRITRAAGVVAPARRPALPQRKVVAATVAATVDGEDGDEYYADGDVEAAEYGNGGNGSGNGYRTRGNGVETIPLTASMAEGNGG